MIEFGSHLKYPVVDTETSLAEEKKDERGRLCATIRFSSVLLHGSLPEKCCLLRIIDCLSSTNFFHREVERFLGDGLVKVLFAILLDLWLI